MPDRMWELLNSLDLQTYLPKARFEDSKYVKILLEQTADYEIFMICWKAGQSTPIHDHPEGGCWMRVVSGELEETEYAMPTVWKMGTHRLTVGDVGYKQGYVVLHSIRAIEDTISLHLYSPPRYKANTYTRDP
jgi:cysteine dioxygenase